MLSDNGFCNLSHDFANVDAVKIKIYTRPASLQNRIHLVTQEFNQASCRKVRNF